MSKTIENVTGYRAPKAKVIDLVVSAPLCQTSSWSTDTDLEEDQLP